MKFNEILFNSNAKKLNGVSELAPPLFLNLKKDVKAFQKNS